MTLWEILKANKTGIAPDMFTMLAASKMNGGRDRLHELSGIPPLSFTAKGKPLTSWSITGNTVQNGTPTPENPVEVQAVGDRTGNLFDYSTIRTGYRIAWATGADYADNTAMMSDYIKVKNTTYRCSDKAVIICYDGNKNYLGALNNSMVVEKEVGTFYDMFTINDNECKFIKLLTYQGFVIGNKTMLNEGSTALPYEPYGYKIPVVTRGKNLFDKTAVRYEVAIGASSLVNYPGSAIFIMPAIKNVKNYTIRVESDVDINVTRLAFYDKPIPVPGENVNNIKETLKSKNPTVTSSNVNNLPYIVVQISGAFVDSYGLDTVQLEIGDTATPYEPYHEPITTPIYLDKPLYSGEVMRSDGTITRSDGTTETFTAPQIPTLNGTTVIDVDTAVKPESMTIKYRR